MRFEGHTYQKFTKNKYGKAKINIYDNVEDTYYHINTEDDLQAFLKDLDEVVLDSTKLSQFERTLSDTIESYKELNKSFIETEEDVVFTCFGMIANVLEQIHNELYGGKK